MQGNLSEFTLAELLQLFALAERTGTIAIQGPLSSARMFLESGKVVGIGDESFDVHREIMACELLPARSGAALDAVVPTPSTPGLSFIVRNLVEPERWDLFVQRCLEQSIYPLLTLERGSFDVKIERIPPCPLRLSVPVQQLVLDGSRWEAEMAEHRLDGFGMETIWSRGESPGQSFEMSAVEWLTWSLLNQPSNLSDVARRVCVPDLATADAVRRLHANGILTRLG